MPAGRARATGKQHQLAALDMQSTDRHALLVDGDICVCIRCSMSTADFRRVYIFIYIYIYTCVQPHMYVHICVHMHLRICVHVCACIVIRPSEAG